MNITCSKCKASIYTWDQERITCPYCMTVNAVEGFVKDIPVADIPSTIEEPVENRITKKEKSRYTFKKIED